MNVLLVALGSAGDVYPLVGLGLSMRARRHRVTLLANSHFESLTVRVGLGFREIAPAVDYHAVVENPRLWKPISGAKLVFHWLVLEPMRSTFNVIRENHIPGETVIVAPVSAFGARIAQESLKIPLKAAVDACDQLNMRALLMTRYQDQVPHNLRPSIGSYTFLPYSRLFPRAPLVVHHGGIGTASQALRAGVPHLVMPMAFDQHDNASRLKRLGVAECISPGSFFRPGRGAGHRRLVESRHVAESCRRCAEQLRAKDSLDEPCQLIENAARRCTLSGTTARSSPIV